MVRNQGLILLNCLNWHSCLYRYVSLTKEEIYIFIVHLFSVFIA